MIDHLVFATPDLDATTADLRERLGVTAMAGGKHLGAGTHNALIGLGGGAYLEVIGPDPDQDAPASPRPFGIDALGAARLVTWAVRVDDIDARARAAVDAGYDPGPVLPLSRELPDGGRLEWRLTFGSGHDGLVPFLIDWGSTPHPSAAAPQVAQLVEFFAEHPDPEGVRTALRALAVELDVRPGSAHRLVAVLDTPRGRVVL